MMKDYVASTEPNSPQVIIKRQLETPMLGSTTYIYEVSNDRKCNGDSSTPDTRFMVLDEGNPLVSEFNSKGVNVKANEPISLLLHSIAGIAKQCSVIVKFTPETNFDYQIQLSGVLQSPRPTVCKAEIFGISKTTNLVKPLPLEYHKVCNG
ncbi:hypothetical protein [Pseudoalteromonas ulvae]|uniref:hypothetical protein n=1 Tax=Pseudoalteromonas ulvae TaxID=107327 RepID=UPI00186B7756|nr:hypothetical protein [Pseudoalteromonas ulvae]